MTYAVKEIFYTLQGEGGNTGRAAVFCRFSGCNLWNGCEAHRNSAICRFCDTDFVGTDGPGGDKFTSADSLASAIAAAQPKKLSERKAEWMVVCTGGEPLLQLDEPLIEALHKRGAFIAVETNGTISPPNGIDWLCVSPKGGAPLAAIRGDELKLVYPQPRITPEMVEDLDFGLRFLQPMDGPRLEANKRAALEYCLRNPTWRLSLQTHKLLGIP